MTYQNTNLIHLVMILLSSLLWVVGCVTDPQLPEGQLNTENATGLTPRLAVAKESVSSPQLVFFENKGQIRRKNQNVRYALEAKGMTCYLQPDGLNYTFRRIENTGNPDIPSVDPDEPALRAEVSSVALHWSGANPEVIIRAEEPALEVRNYYTTGTPEGITHVRSYRRIVYENLYDRIDLRLYIQGEELKYDFVVKPGGKVSDIQWGYSGQEKLTLTPDGELLIGDRLGELTEGRPYTYQQHSGAATEISSRYTLEDERVGIKVGKYDPHQPLVIDPTLLWSTYYGGEEADWGNAVCTDQWGNVYMAGTTFSYQNIAADGHDLYYQTGSPVEEDAFLVKFDAAGNRLWATYYGGLKQEGGEAVCIDPSGNVYLAGHTDSHTDIAFNGHDNKFSADGLADGNRFWRDAFLVKFSSDGVRQWGTYYGGEDERSDVGTGVASDADGNVFLTGYTNSETEIAYHGYDNSYGDSFDAFLVKFNSAGVRQWGTYFGKSGDDQANAISIDIGGSVYIAGITTSESIGYKGHDMSYGESHDAFLAKFSNDGDLYWSTYYGGSGYDEGTSVATDASAFVYLAGVTRSTNYISSPNPHDATYNGEQDAFLVKFNFLGQRQWSTYYGGKDKEDDTRVCTSNNGDVYLAGTTKSETGIATTNGLKTEVEIYDAYLVRFNNIMKRQWGTYFGGSSNEYGHGIATDGLARVYLTGRTYSPGIAYHGFQSGKNGSSDAFLAKFEPYRRNPDIPDGPGETNGLASERSINMNKNTKAEIPSPEVDGTMNPMSLSLYPNPATEQIMITLPNSTEMTVYLEVYEIGGRSVFRQQYEGAVSQSIEVSGWKRGLYIAKLRTRFTEISEKFVVR